jgi:hypothetical protein
MPEVPDCSGNGSVKESGKMPYNNFPRSGIIEKPSGASGSEKYQYYFPFGSTTGKNPPDKFNRFTKLKTIFDLV